MLRVLAAVVLVFTAAGVVTVGESHSASASPDAQPELVVDGQEFDRQTFRIDVKMNGSVRWTYVYRRDLATQSEREQFTSFAKTFNKQENPELYAHFKQGAHVLTDKGTNQTGRQMNASSFSREAYVSRLDNSGIVKMSFLWSNFSEVDGNRVIVGDVFTGGLYIRQNQRIEISWSDEMRAVNASPEPDDQSSNTYTWVASNTSRQFYDSKPQVVLKTDNEDASSYATTTEWLPLSWLTGFAVVVLIGLGLGIALRRGFITLRLPAELSNRSTEENGSRDEMPTITEADLMTDEDRILSLLRENGGRMKQVKIVEQTGWSKSKVSMLLSEMDDEDLISKLRVGRENIISLVGNEPEAVRSPFEDE
ncbi:helix-turn-helix transcriptional regulator [Halocatena pleomorpha]|uniref:Uncharacterized protein n=1 Tax=Halocatena pleomorpha TaxID=1785090 RepID=A0A3P3RBZ9_9EURY|nr:helix-turn-helix domain-containing protein [Halocatena pleomorpha]RRJ30489.1 hypothetical protein EIK79_09390 [Halocatena pleomorpha]